MAGATKLSLTNEEAFALVQEHGVTGGVKSYTHRLISREDWKIANLAIHENRAAARSWKAKAEAAQREIASLKEAVAQTFKQDGTTVEEEEPPDILEGLLQ
jgi:hypothetical protein